MPDMPAFLANVLIPRFARHVQVAEVVEVSPSLRTIRFAGEALRNISFRAGQEVELRVSERALRHYTPSDFDTRRGVMEVIFFLHGEGPGAKWVAGLNRGQHVNVLGPGGHFGLRSTSRHVLLGDESALGLFLCLENAAPGRCIGAVEVSAEGSAWPQRIGLSLPTVRRTATRGDALAAWLDGSTLKPNDDVCFYLVGHTASIVRLREKLLQRGFSRRSIRTKPYWADGKRGL